MKTMRKVLAGSCLSTLCIARAAAAGDPCDFVTGSPTAFPYEQVKQCYESVPFQPTDLRNIVAVIEQHRSFSDLSEIYDSRIHWKHHLSEIAGTSYANDFAMHEALKTEHKRFRDGHVAYSPPACYWRMVHAVTPFDFGVTTRFATKNEKQLVFIEATYLADEYQQFSGIDARKFVGMKVVAINGMPTLEYFRKFGREHMNTHEDDGGHLNAILNHAAYSVRLGNAHDFIPDQPVDEYLLESRQGVRQRVKLPWMFAPASMTTGDVGVPLTKSSAEFREQCLRAQSPAQLQADVATPPLQPSFAFAPPFERHEDDALQGWAKHLDTSSESFYEVPPEFLNQGVETIIPRTGSAEVLQYRGHTTVLRVFDTVGWVDVARQGVAHACEHSQRLIVDVRGNNGGQDTVIQWLHRHLFPTVTAVAQSGKIVVRARNDNEAFNEALFNMAAFEALRVGEGATPCSTGLVTPGCIVDPNTGGFLRPDELQWFRWPSVVEWRGGAPVSLSRQVGMSPEPKPVTLDAATCAGRFAGNALIFLTDGTNASGGYFLPSAFKGEAAIVTIGGFVDEPLAMGRAHGGLTVGGSEWALLAQSIPKLSNGAITFRHKYVDFDREVETYMEMAGAYRKDRRTLHIEQPLGPDLFLDLWSDSRATAGYVYEHVLEAVDSPWKRSVRR